MFMSMGKIQHSSIRATIITPVEVHMGEEEKTPPRETSPGGDNDQPDMEQVQVGKSEA
jgi:hypothetical protein